MESIGQKRQDELLTPREVSAYLKVPESTLTVWRSTGRVFIRYLKVGRGVRYRRGDVDCFPSRNAVAQMRRSELYALCVEQVRPVSQQGVRHLHDGPQPLCRADYVGETWSPYLT